MSDYETCQSEPSSPASRPSTMYTRSDILCEKESSSESDFSSLVRDDQKSLGRRLNARPKMEEYMSYIDSPHHERRRQSREITLLPPPPEITGATLHPFQVEGYSWMVAQESNPAVNGGILADEMGLGKTIQTLCLIAGRKKIVRPTLVVSPLSSMVQWTDEMKKCRPHSPILKVFTYYGESVLSAPALRKFDLVLTSYETLRIEHSRHEKLLARQEEGESDPSSGDSCVSLSEERTTLFKIEWGRVVLDEAHRIRAQRNKTTKACYALSAKYRWCLTGTPIQNQMSDVQPLLRFLQFRPYAYYHCFGCSCMTFKFRFGDCPTCGDPAWMHYSYFHKNVLCLLKKGGSREVSEVFGPIHDALILRRTKEDVALELPPLIEKVSKVTLSPEERDFYNGIAKECTRRLHAIVEQGLLKTSYPLVLSWLLQLRQASNHRLLAVYPAGNKIWKMVRPSKARPSNPEALSCELCFLEVTRSHMRIPSCGHIFHKDCLLILASEVPSLLAKTSNCLACHLLTLQTDTSPELTEASSDLLVDIAHRGFQSSSKIDAIVRELAQVPPNSKVLIFSQFTRMLELLEYRLGESGYKSAVFTGSMKLAERSQTVDRFRKEPDLRVLLVSLTAGGEGLNLQVADWVFIVDPWWNPAVELQAIHRAHRIGQTAKQVNVVRFVTEDSVEEKIINLQAVKRLLAEAVVDLSPYASWKLNQEDVSFLFEVEVSKPRRKKLRTAAKGLGSNEVAEIPDSQWGPDLIAKVLELRARGVPFTNIATAVERPEDECRSIILKEAWKRKEG